MSDHQEPLYKLFYPAPFPGRGEHVRLLLEEAGCPYVEATMEEFMQAKKSNVFPDCRQTTPLYAPPYFQYGSDLVLSQTPNILQFLATRLGLAGETNAVDSQDSFTLYHLNGLVLTALDGLSDEIHGCHHPLGGNFYYEDTKSESLRRSQDYVNTRLPAFLAYFESVLDRNGRETQQQQPWLYGRSLTYADIVLFQCVHGTKHQFPEAMKWFDNSGKYSRVFKHAAAVSERPNIRAYFESSRRRAYGNGIYRYYPELDVRPDVEIKPTDIPGKD